jgi:hypothetical protein
MAQQHCCSERYLSRVDIIAIEFYCFWSNDHNARVFPPERFLGAGRGTLPRNLSSDFRSDVDDR